MHVAALQSAGCGPDPAANLAALDTAAGHAAARGARLLVTPEMFLTGYNIGAAAVARAAVPADGEPAAAVAAIAQRHEIGLVYGYPERAADGRIYNSAALVSASGERLANHRKTHLFGDLDRSAFCPGDGPVAIAEFEGLQVGLLICYDVEFPENVRTLALAGVDLVVVPTALMTPFEFVTRTMLPTRAFENQVFIVYANRCGAEGRVAYCGSSCIVGPDGGDVARAGAAAALISGALDERRLGASRALNTYLSDRRPELYGAVGEDRRHDDPAVEK